MTQKRKAELQRKLSMAPVAKPPSGLAERIKSDIPEYLRPQRDRERFSQSMAFSLRVAASIILLVTSVFLTMEMISRDKSGPVGVARTDALNPAAQAPPPPPAQEMSQNVAVMKDAAETHAEAPASTIAGGRKEAKEERGTGQSAAAPLRAVAAPPPPAIEQQNATESDIATVGGVTGKISRDNALVAESVQVTAAAPAVAPPAEPAPAYASKTRADAPPPTVAGASSRPVESVARLQRAAFASEESTEPFGISTDPSVVDKLKKIIDRGDAPPKNVDVAAVVNHFAGASTDDVDDVRLQVEASQAPLETDGTAIIRYTIDTPANLTSAEVSIVLEKGVIASLRTIGGDRPLEASTGSLRAGQSATGLVEVKLKPDTPVGERVARVILRYRSPATLRTVQVTREVRAENLGQTWSAASRRHRLATLSAAWGESLSSAQRQEDLARTAQELAWEAPKDQLAPTRCRPASPEPARGSPTSCSTA
jgi:hypothetical protein